MIYRRLIGSDAWHFTRNCSNWPGHGYEEERLQQGKRPSGELCNECKAKQTVPKKRKKR